MTTTISGAQVTTSKVVSTDEDFTNPPAVLTPQSMVRLNTANGYGSTNNKIRRFTNIVANQGSDITYADSASDGASFTINKDGVYAISFCDSFTGANAAGISLNSSELTTAITSLTTVADRLAVATAVAASNGVQVACTLFLSAGDIIRAHNDGGVASTPEAVFTITRIS